MQFNKIKKKTRILKISGPGSLWWPNFSKRNQLSKDTALKFYVILSMTNLKDYLTNMKMQLKKRKVYSKAVRAVC